MERRGSEPYVEKSFLLQNSDYGNEMLQKLHSMRRPTGFSDVVLCVEQEELHCHKSVLAASSPYFMAMFSSNLKESHEDKIVFNEMSPWTLKRIIDYAYTGCIEITEDNAQELLGAGNLFEYPEIVKESCNFLYRHLHPSNCLGIEHFAHLHSCIKLEEDAHKYALENFSNVVECEEFLELCNERLIVYISSDLIDVQNEETVYHAVMNWVHRDLDNRQNLVCDILEHVRLATVDVGYLEDVIENDKIVMNCDRCRELVEDAKKYHESKISDNQQGKRRLSMQTAQNQPRPSTVAKEVIVVIGGFNNYISQSVDMYEPMKNKWNALPDLPPNVSWFSASAIANDIYVAGGIVEGHIVSDVWVFDSSKRIWSTCKQLLSPRARHCSAVFNDKLYLIGGVNLDSKMVFVEEIDCYDPETKEWSHVGQSPFPRKQSHSAPYNQTLIEVGGIKGDICVKAMESYHCRGKSVEYSGEQFILPEPIEFAKIVVLNGLFYIIWEESKRMISLNPEKRTFRRLTDLKYVHIHSGVTVLMDKIYIAGGMIDSKPSRIVECYDPHTNTWSIVKSLPHARACHGCVTIQM